MNRARPCVGAIIVSGSKGGSRTMNARTKPSASWTSKRSGRRFNSRFAKCDPGRSMTRRHCSQLQRGIAMRCPSGSRITSISTIRIDPFVSCSPTESNIGSRVTRSRSIETASTWRRCGPVGRNDSVDAFRFGAAGARSSASQIELERKSWGRSPMWNPKMSHSDRVDHRKAQAREAKQPIQEPGAASDPSSPRLGGEAG